MNANIVIKPETMGIKASTINGVKIKPISWDDFSHPPPSNTWFLAHIYWHIQYQYGPINPTTKLPIITVRPLISAKSWKKDHLKFDLLSHEYGHYLIGCLCALDFQSQANSADPRQFSTVEEFKEWAKALFRSLMKKYCKMERQYDQDTQHYCNEEQQAIWESKIAYKINSYQKADQLKKKPASSNNRRPMSLNNPSNNNNYRIRETAKKPSINKPIRNRVV